MNFAKLIVPGVLIVAIMVAYYFMPKSDSVPQTQVLPVADQSVSPIGEEKPAAPAEQAKANKVAEAAPEQKTLREITPTAEQMKKQVEADPHGTPEALLQFSVTLSEKQAEAVKSEEAAKTFLGELENCAREEKGRHSIQALCLLNAKRLEKAYPTLSGDYQRMEQMTDPAAVTIMKGMAL